MKDGAREGITKLVSQPVTSQDITNAPFETRQAKTLASRPASMLMLRIAQVGDRKRKGARDASRYYLLHPEEDPTERMRQEFANGHGDYKRRRYDAREHRRRKDGDQNGDNIDFTASMYDDAPSTEPERTGRSRDLFSRVTRRRSASPTGSGLANSDGIEISDSDDDGGRRRQRNGYRDRKERPPPYSRNDPAPYPKANVGKELFSSDSKQEGGLRSDKMELQPSPSFQARSSQPRPSNAADSRANAAAARRLKADLMSAQTSPRAHHRRSHAMDAKNAEDLSERFARKSISIDSTKSMNDGRLELFPSGGMNIRGSADNGLSIKGQGGLSIKGRALEAKELFPERYKKNEGKELFDEPVREKRVRRRAGDLFD